MPVTQSRDIEVIDGQLHDFGPRSANLIVNPEIQRQIMLEGMISSMEAVGVHGALLHPKDDMLANLAIAEFPDRFAKVIQVEATEPNLEEQLTTVQAQAGTLGVRIIAGTRSSGVPLDPRCAERIRLLRTGGYDRFFQATTKLGLPVFLFAAGDLSLAEQILARFPELILIIDHLGLRQPPADQRDAPPFRLLPDLLALARFPNVAVKVCGALSLSETGRPYEDVWPHVAEVINAYGIERLIWGSDISRFQCRSSWDWAGRAAADYKFANDGRHTYADALSYFRDTERLTQSEKHLLLSGNLRRILGWRSTDNAPKSWWTAPNS